MRQTEDDDEQEWQDEDESSYIPCPNCGETMLEDAEYCPACDRWITSEDQPQKRQSWWIVVIILALIATMIFTVLPF